MRKKSTTSERINTFLWFFLALLDRNGFPMIYMHAHHTVFRRRDTPSHVWVRRLPISFLRLDLDCLCHSFFLFSFLFFNPFLCCLVAGGVLLFSQFCCFTQPHTFGFLFFLLLLLCTSKKIFSWKASLFCPHWNPWCVWTSIWGK